MPGFKKTHLAVATHPSRGRVLQRCGCGRRAGGGSCPECKRKSENGILQRRHAAVEAIDVAPPIVGEVLRSPGQPLDRGTREFFEPRFGHDFSGVRVHADALAAESAQAVNALAYTVGRDVVFDSGQYVPGTSQGRQLIAHELTHVVQQSRNPRPAVGPDAIASDGPSEHEAAQSSSLTSGSQSVFQHVPAPTIQRQGAGGGAAGPAAAPAVRRFAAEGVSVVIRGSCAPDEFGFDNVEDGVRGALDAIFNTECIEESRRTRIQRNLRAHGLDVRCRLSANLETPGACAESTGFSIPANIFTLGSGSFSNHPDSDDGCQPIESIILHEIVHLTRGFAGGLLPSSCEASCFGVGGGDPALCRDIDVFGNRHAH
jgi:hypothetical protein